MDSAHILDLVITDDPAIVENIELLSPLGKSDHAVLQIKCNLQASQEGGTTKLNYKKVIMLTYASI